MKLVNKFVNGKEASIFCCRHSETIKGWWPAESCTSLIFQIRTCAVQPACVPHNPSRKHCVALCVYWSDHFVFLCSYAILRAVNEFGGGLGRVSAACNELNHWKMEKWCKWPFKLPFFFQLQPNLEWNVEIKMYHQQIPCWYLWVSVGICGYLWVLSWPGAQPYSLEWTQFGNVVQVPSSRPRWRSLKRNEWRNAWFVVMKSEHADNQRRCALYVFLFHFLSSPDITRIKVSWERLLSLPDLSSGQPCLSSFRVPLAAV